MGLPDTILPIIISSANDVFVDNDGNMAYLTDDKLYVESTNENVISAMLQSGINDLGDSAIIKTCNYVWVDYEGEFTLELTFYPFYDALKDTQPSAKVVTFTLLDEGSRVVKKLEITQADKIPFQKFRYKVTTNDPNWILYGLELDIDSQKEYEDV